MGSPELQKQPIEVPRDLFDYTYPEDAEDFIPTGEDMAEQIVPKMLAFLDTFPPESKADALEAVEQAFLQFGPGLDAEEANGILKEIYKKLILAKL